MHKGIQILGEILNPKAICWHLSVTMSALIRTKYMIISVEINRDFIPGMCMAGRSVQAYNRNAGWQSPFEEMDAYPIGMDEPICRFGRQPL